VPSALDSVKNSAESLGFFHEIIVVDDASADRTSVLAENFGAKVVKVNLRKISAVRNAGARASQGEFLIFVDADTLLNIVIVDQAVKALRLGAVGGGAAAQFDEPLPAYSKVLVPAINWFSRRFGLAYGCFLFCTRAAFDSVGGFDESLYGAEEWALSRALKKLGRFVILRDSVLTSGRKMRAHSGYEILKVFGLLALGGPNAVRRKNRMAIWYDGRRKDPTLNPSEEN
jgi:glycosyltransferase involved in cell wall biosynthesis